MNFTQDNEFDKKVDMTDNKLSASEHPVFSFCTTEPTHPHLQVGASDPHFDQKLPQTLSVPKSFVKTLFEHII